MLVSPEQEYPAEGPVRPDRGERPFTGRGAYVRKFVDVLERQDPQKSRVLVYHGMGGIGKSRLAKELGRVLDGESELEETGVLDDLRHHSWFCWAKMDFEESNHRKPAQGLYYLRTRLLEKYGFRFPTFDIAFAEYWSKAYPATPLPKPDPSVLEEHGDLIVEISNLLEEVPAAGIMARLPKRLGELNREAKRWYRKRNEEALQGVPSLQPHEIEMRLPGFWTLDFNREIQQDQWSAVFSLDTYEALREDRRSEHQWHRDDQWIREWVAGLEDATVLVTGRHQLRWPEVREGWEPILEQHEMEELSPQDSRRLLERSGIEEDAIREHIVEATSGIPYDLELAIDFYEEIKRRDEEPKPEDFGETPGELSESFFRYLGDNEMAMLELLGVPRSFDEDLVWTLTDEFDPGFPAGQFNRLKRFAFVNRIGGDSQGQNTFSLHDRARDALREHAEFYQDPEEVHEFLFDYYREELEDLEPREVGPRHEQSLQEAFYNGHHFLGVEEFVEWFLEREQIFNQAARWQMLVVLYERLLSLQRTALEKDNSQTATTLNNLAGIYREQGDFGEAEQAYTRALNVRESVLGGEHPKVAETLNNLGLLYQRQGKYQTAEQVYTRALKIEESTFDEEQPQLAETLNNLGLLYWRQGKHKEAEPHYIRALEIRKSTLGEEHFLVAETLHNLGLLYQRQGKYERAESKYAQTLEIEESILGKEHPRVATTLNNFGLLCQRLGKYEEAESKYTRALEIRKSTLGEEHPRVSTTLHNLGLLYQKQGKYEKAESKYTRSMEVKEFNFGEKHRRSAPTLNSLARLYRGQGKYELAELYFERALEIRKSNLRENHPRIAETLNDRAVLYRKQERYKESESLFEQALKIRKSSFRKDHPRIAEIKKELALLYNEQKEREEAVELLKQALEIAQKELGQLHPETQEIAASLKTVRGVEGE